MEQNMSPTEGGATRGDAEQFRMAASNAYDMSANEYRAGHEVPAALLVAHALAHSRCAALAQEGFDTYQLDVGSDLNCHYCVDGCAYFGVATVSLSAGQQVSPWLAIRVRINAELTPTDGAALEVRKEEISVCLIQTRTGRQLDGVRLAAEGGIPQVVQAAKGLLADRLYAAGLRAQAYSDEPTTPEQLAEWGRDIDLPPFEQITGLAPCHELMELNLKERLANDI